MEDAPIIKPERMSSSEACPECSGRCSGLCSRAWAGGEEFRLRRLALLLDHTLLRPEAGRAAIQALCDEARYYGFASVCVHPVWVAEAVAGLRQTPVRVGTVISFPLGATTATARRAEAAEVLRLGADELDMVLDLGGLKDGNDVRVLTGIRGVVELAHAAGARVKVILETALLTDEEKVRGCHLALQAGADFVKTSTGFAGGATVADVALLRQCVGAQAGVKASGGIRTYSQLLAMVAAGASRIGASASVAILKEAAAVASDIR